MKGRKRGVEEESERVQPYVEIKNVKVLGLHRCTFAVLSYLKYYITNIYLWCNGTKTVTPFGATVLLLLHRI
jgi:hypothetical protein